MDRFLKLKRADGSDLMLHPDMIVSICKPADAAYTTITLVNCVAFPDIIETPETIMDAIEWIK